jgi:hypothetical protein
MSSISSDRSTPPIIPFHHTSVNVSCGCTGIPKRTQSRLPRTEKWMSNVEDIDRILNHSGPWDSTASLSMYTPTPLALAFVMKA